jgi:hypothetical protein
MFVMSKSRFATKQCALTSRRFQSVVASKTDFFIDLEDRTSAHNYHPIPRVLCRGSGVNVWDVEGKVRVICVVLHQ